VSSRESSDEEEEELTSDEGTSWISWYCSLRGSEFFVEVDEAWIEDDFNLHGLSSVVPNYEYALDLILDRDSDVQFSEDQAEMIQASAEMLYGLIHARYILTGMFLSDAIRINVLGLMNWYFPVNDKPGDSIRC
jgi:casein kinase II subunit beta